MRENREELKRKKLGKEEKNATKKKIREKIEGIKRPDGAIRFGRTQVKERQQVTKK